MVIIKNLLNRKFVNVAKKLNVKEIFSFFKYNQDSENY